jgi:hypothetical protein
MGTNMSVIHKKRFEEIRKSLTVIGPREMNFLKVELLFYEVLDIAKNYGIGESNVLLGQLRQLDRDQYTKAKAPTAKSRQREINIRHFISGLKNILSNP